MYLFSFCFFTRIQQERYLLSKLVVGSRYLELNSELVYVVRSDVDDSLQNLREKTRQRLLTKDRCRGESVPFSVMTGKI